jgi:hypothetical protein
MSIQLLPLFPVVPVSPMERPPLLAKQSNDPKHFPAARPELRTSDWDNEFRARWWPATSPHDDDSADE